jgi:isochorismate synthase/2-succinyl-5-enolpyruvyl-6-hydroxy-3-cyclohexene-1-carboxylate synthase/2-succinyl-6-hydroxy-2,4-cyclohexadiene-1-carboxylate synthase/O-succinylbenzoate synthase
MGARVALAAAAALADDGSSFLKKKRGGGVVSIGGSPGIAGAEARKNRAERDDAMANALRASGVESFARAWYRQGLFRSLTAHPRYSVSHLASLRARSCSCGDDEEASRSAAERLASLLSAASPGRQNAIDAQTLASSGTRLDFVTGAADTKFVKVAETLAEEIRTVARSSGRKNKNKNARVTTTLVPGAGHAAHLEAPETLVLRLLRIVRDDE